VESDDVSFGSQFVTSFNQVMNVATSSLVQTGAGTSYWPPPLGVTGTVQSQQVSVVPQEAKPGWQVGSLTH
jgi:hypothetical protein